MSRVVQILIYSLLLFVALVVDARADVPVVLDYTRLDSSGFIEVTLPSGVEWCHDGSKSGKIKLLIRDLIAGKDAELTYTGDCADAATERIYAAAIEVSPKFARARVQSGSATPFQIVVSFDKPVRFAKIPAPLASMWLGGVEFAAANCTGTSCTFASATAPNLSAVPMPSELTVSVAHERNLTNAYKASDGTSWQPESLRIEEWLLPASADSLEQTLDRRQGPNGTVLLESEFQLDIPYAFLIAEGPFACKNGSQTINKCGKVVTNGAGSPKIEIDSNDAKTSLERTNGAELELELRTRDAIQYKTQSATDARSSFVVTVNTASCAFEVKQITPISRGVKGAQVMFEVSPITQTTCAIGGWTVSSRSTVAGSVVGSLRTFSGVANVYLLEVDTTAGEFDAKLPLTFAYPSGTVVETGVVELRIDGRAPLGQPLISINTDIEENARAEKFTEVEITDTIAQGRRSLLQFKHLADPTQWWLRIPSAVQADACRHGHKKNGNLIQFAQYDNKQLKTVHQGFCVDIERNPERTVKLGLERRATLDQLLPEDHPTRTKFFAVLETELFLGSALETIEVAQAPFAIKTPLLSRMRLVCGDLGTVSWAPSTDTRAVPARALRKCNLYFELEQGAFDRLARQVTTGDKHQKHETINIKKDDQEDLIDYTRHREVSPQSESRFTDGTDKPNGKDPELATLPNACTAPSSSYEKNPAELRHINQFVAEFGRQKLEVKLWELSADNEFKVASGSENVIRFRLNDIDTGEYQHRVDHGVLAMCVDLTNQGEAARKAYEIVKITVDHVDSHYVLDWDDRDPIEFSAKRRRMPALAVKPAARPTGVRFYFSLAVPVMIRYPSTGLESNTSSTYRLANAVSFQAGIVAGFEPWNFDENRPWSPAFNPQVFAGALILALPTQSNPSPLAVSVVGGLGFRLPSGDDASAPVEASTSLLLWAEGTPSARGVWVASLLFGFNVSIGFFGS